MKILVRMVAGGFVGLLSTGVVHAQYGQIPAAPLPKAPIAQPATPTPSEPSSAAPQTTPPRPAPARPKAAPKAAAPATKAPAKPTAEDAECAWTGKRIVSLLARDDVDAAHKFQRFYEQFSCPTEHVQMAFRCVAMGGAPAPAKALTDRVDQCWDKPTIQFLNR